MASAHFSHRNSTTVYNHREPRLHISQSNMVRSILVTGANQGVGMHTVHQLASTPEVLVFMGSRKIVAAEESLAKFAADIHPTSTVVPVQLDITDDASIAAAHELIADTLKAKGISALDVLVNNAAVATPGFKELYAVNVIGTAAVTTAIRPLLTSGSTILNVSSGFGSFAFHLISPALPIIPMYAAYISSKAALNALTVQWGLQEKQAGSGIRVVSVCPGSNATKMNDYTGTMSPADGCKIVVKTALEKGGRTAVFVDKDGDRPW
ncbi:hypothetical protein C8R44DRAFT_760800 [Mycena epipterygia]|nr:hypothetical protein C8R44DRAFT_760800 [Mycena epipterygia]